MQLDAALAARPGLAARLVLRPFRLHPDWPAEGVAWAAFQHHRGLPDAVFRRVELAGAAHGLASISAARRAVPTPRRCTG